MESVKRITLGWIFLSVIVLSAAVWAAYWGSLDGSFQFDDLSLIVKNDSLGDSRTGIEHYAQQNRFRRYLYTTLHYDRQRAGLDPRAFHVTNTVIHQLATLSLFLVLLMFGGAARLPPERTRPWAFWSALLFAVHPIQTEAVTYIAGRAESLAALFMLLGLALWLYTLHGEGVGKAASAVSKALLFFLLLSATRLSSAILFQVVIFSFLSLCAYAYYRERGGERLRRLGFDALTRGGAYLFSIAAYILAIQTKEVAAAMPLALFAYAMTIAPLSGGKITDRAFKLSLPFFAPLLAVLVFRYRQFGTLGNPDTTRNLLTTLSTNATVLLSYIQLLVAPVGQNVDHDFPLRTTFFDRTVLASMAALALVAYLCWRERARRRLPVYGALWFFLCLAPTTTLLPIEDVLVERRLYLPSMAFIWALLYIVLEWSDKPGAAPRRKYAIYGALTTAALLLLGATVARNRVWKTEVSLWRDAAAKSPKKERVLFNLANAYLKAHQPIRALETYSSLLKLNHKHLEGHLNTGLAMMEIENYKDALTMFGNVVHLEPCNVEALYNMARIYELHDKSGEGAERAEKKYRKILECDPDHAPALYRLGLQKVASNEPLVAVSYFERAVGADPDLYDAHEKLARHYIAFFPDVAKAEAHVRELVRIRPDACSSYIWLGNFLSSKGDARGAMEAYREGIVKNHDCGGIYMYAGRLQEQLGDPRKANYYYRKAVALDPSLARPKYVPRPPEEKIPDAGK